jgi:hypothetical protein
MDEQGSAAAHGRSAMRTEVSEFFTLTQPKVFHDIAAVSYCVENAVFFKLIGDGTPIATG